MSVAFAVAAGWVISAKTKAAEPLLTGLNVVPSGLARFIFFPWIEKGRRARECEDISEIMDTPAKTRRPVSCIFIRSYQKL